jgi:hypothetical protein
MYPIPPKPEWFMNATTELHSPHVTGGAGSNLTTSFVKMKVDQYTDYLSSHNAWRRAVHAIDTEEHDYAMIRRGLTRFTETPIFGDGTLPDKAPSTRTIVKPGLSTVTVVSKLKEVHQPQLSLKPHRTEKRVEKKNLTNMKQATAVGIIKAKTIALKETLATKQLFVTAAEKISQQSIVTREQSKAAKAAVQIAKDIRLSSPDLVSGIDTDHDWKVVTRRKGDFMPTLAQVGETIAGGNSVWQVSKDPVAAVSMVPKTAVRRPNAVEAS